jgi:hypothetical protein
MSKPNICFISIILLICGSDSLALTCPYLGGNAVYRARSILGMLNPGIHYDDLIICNSQGVYKNGTSKLQNWLAQIKEIKSKKRESSVNSFSIYPNPANEFIELHYALNENEMAKLSFYDLIGNKVFEKQLDKEDIASKIAITNLKTGLYVYTFIDSRGNTFHGKLIIN